MDDWGTAYPGKWSSMLKRRVLQVCWYEWKR